MVEQCARIAIPLPEKWHLRGYAKQKTSGLFGIVRF